MATYKQRAEAAERELAASQARNADISKKYNDSLIHASNAEQHLSERIAGLESYAARYRWLREAPNDFPHPFIAIRMPINVVSQARAETADFAVDQAISMASRVTKS